MRGLTPYEYEALDRAVLGVLYHTADEALRRIGNLLTDEYRTVAWDALSFAIFDSLHGLPTRTRGRARLGHVARQAVAALYGSTGLAADPSQFERVLLAVVGWGGSSHAAPDDQVLATAVLVEAGLLLLANPSDAAAEWQELVAVVEVTADVAA